MFSRALAGTSRVMGTEIEYARSAFRRQRFGVGRKNNHLYGMSVHYTFPSQITPVPGSPDHFVVDATFQ